MDLAEKCTKNYPAQRWGPRLRLPRPGPWVIMVVEGAGQSPEPASSSRTDILPLLTPYSGKSKDEVQGLPGDEFGVA